MTRTSIILAATTLLLAAAPAFAQPAISGTKLVLAETVAREVEQDTLVAILTARAGGATAAEAQGAVNALMTAAVEQARGAPSVRRATGGYRMTHERDRDGRTRGWVAEQDLRLTGREAAPLLELAGALQTKGFLAGGLSYVLSNEARKAVEAELTTEALAALRARAERVAEAMAMRLDAIETVRLGSVDHMPGPRPMMMARAGEPNAAPPVALPDRETVRLTAEADVRLVAR